MKQEFEMLQQEMDDIIAINKSQMPIMLIGNVTTGMDLQERINAYWKGLSDKYGFKQFTVEGSSRGALFFLAEPKPIVVPMGEFKQYRRKSVSEMCAWEEGMVIEHLSISEEDKKNGSPKLGDMIARNPKNHNDLWLVAKAYFEDNLEPID